MKHIMIIKQSTLRKIIKQILKYNLYETNFEIKLIISKLKKLLKTYTLCKIVQQIISENFLFNNNIFEHAND